MPSNRPYKAWIILSACIGAAAIGWILFYQWSSREMERIDALVTNLERNAAEFKEMSKAMPLITVQNARWEDDRDVLIDITFARNPRGTDRSDLRITKLTLEKTASDLTLPYNLPPITEGREERMTVRFRQMSRSLGQRLGMRIETAEGKGRSQSWNVSVPFRAPRPDEMPTP
jgi:hypothetical protein